MLFLYGCSIFSMECQQNLEKVSAFLFLISVARSAEKSSGATCLASLKTHTQLLVLSAVLLILAPTWHFSSLLFSVQSSLFGTWLFLLSFFRFFCWDCILILVTSMKFWLRSESVHGYDCFLIPAWVWGATCRAGMPNNWYLRNN